MSEFLFITLALGAVYFTAITFIIFWRMYRLNHLTDKEKSIFEKRLKAIRPSDKQMDKTIDELLDAIYRERKTS